MTVRQATEAAGGARHENAPDKGWRGGERRGGEYRTRSGRMRRSCSPSTSGLLSLPASWTDQDVPIGVQLAVMATKPPSCGLRRRQRKRVPGPAAAPASAPDADGG